MRKKLHEHCGANNQSLTAQPAIESLIDDLFLHRRHDSADSGLGDGKISYITYSFVQLLEQSKTLYFISEKSSRLFIY